MVSTDRTRSNEHRLKYSKLHLNIKNIFTVQVVECWHRLPGDIAEFPFLEIPKRDWTWPERFAEGDPALSREAQR